MENRFYETAKLPKSPYVDSRSREGDVLPAYPPQGYGNTLDSNSKRGPRQAEQFIDQLLELNKKRRGIKETKTGRRTASLNLSGN